MAITLRAETPEGFDATKHYHLGFSAAGAYIGIWHLNNDVYVKKENSETETDEGLEKEHYEQYLSGGHDFKGLGFSFGISGMRDLGEKLALHINLYISLRHRFVNATEHHWRETEYYQDDELDHTSYKDGSKGNYDIVLNYWNLDLPLGIRYKAPRGYFIEIGGLFAYILSANLKVDLISLDFHSYTAGVELGVYTTAGKTFPLPGNRVLELYWNFTFGLTPLLNDRVAKYLYDEIRPREWLAQAGATLWLF